MRTDIVALSLLLAAPVAAEELVPIGSFDWDTELIVGLSGLEVTPDG
ncbi:MAG: hypothetical protein HKO14_11380, partial [Silicimonas sp.]|nr:hypothetical protein [Silicimonas sp.]